ncbi:MAG: lipoyl(octanoyl) transferase LipB [Gemmatimonadaceae bacterium]
MTRALWIEDLGRRPYGEVLDLQRGMAAERIAGTRPDTLILVEHDPVVTLGRATRQGNLLADAQSLAARGVELFEIERGGDVTFHGPGQLVGYPIVDLSQHRQDLHWYLRQLEQVLIDALATYGIEGCRQENLTGVWVGNRKIASIGVHARSWVTWHGFALNVSTDLSYFDLMVPCGIADVTMTSMAQELGVTVPVADVSRRVVDSFANLFGLQAPAHVG